MGVNGGEKGEKTLRKRLVDFILRVSNVTRHLLIKKVARTNEYYGFIGSLKSANLLTLAASPVKLIIILFKSKS